MKVRIGVALGAEWQRDSAAYADAVDALEDLRFDSLWLAELVSQPTVDPLVGLTYAAARTRRLKIGPGVIVLPGRNPVVLAKQLASLDRLADGRLLLAFGLGLPEPAERTAFPVPAGERGQVFDEALGLLRRLWAEDEVTHHGRYFTLDRLRLLPKPVQEPLELWVGGQAPAALRRAGRLSDGWLPSLLTPEQARAGREAIERAAAAAGRRVDPEHFGVSVTVAQGEVPPALAASIVRRRPEADPARLVPVGWDAARRLLGEYGDAGFSKFVVRPVVGDRAPGDALAELAAELLPLQT